MVAKLEAVHPVLMARDVELSVRFFESLGFRVTFRDAPADPRYAVMLRDGVEIHLQWHDAAQFAVPGDRPAYRFLVEDVDALYKEFDGRDAIPGETESGSPWWTPRETPWGTRELHLLDPGDNVLQFYTVSRER